jgi:lipopolysaccharide biosynthesis regulator YciM
MHFALGNLFRRRGETERAIRVHQNLLSRPTCRSSSRCTPSTNWAWTT